MCRSVPRPLSCEGQAYSQTCGFGTRLSAANSCYAVGRPLVRRHHARGLITVGYDDISLARLGKAAATNYLPLVMNYITATAINRSTTTANLRSSVTERAMMNETENRELPIAAITMWVMLFFSSVSLSLSYFAVHTGLLTG
jgi:hypothetical protein